MPPPPFRSNRDRRARWQRNATNATRMAKLLALGKPVNMFLVNLTLGSGSALLEVNGGNNYHSPRPK